MDESRNFAVASTPRGRGLDRTLVGAALVAGLVLAILGGSLLGRSAGERPTDPDGFDGGAVVATTPREDEGTAGRSSAGRSPSPWRTPAGNVQTQDAPPLDGPGRPTTTVGAGSVDGTTESPADAVAAAGPVPPAPAADGAADPRIGEGLVEFDEGTPAHEDPMLGADPSRSAAAPEPEAVLDGEEWSQPALADEPAATGPPHVPAQPSLPPAVAAPLVAGPIAVPPPAALPVPGTHEARDLALHLVVEAPRTVVRGRSFSVRVTATNRGAVKLEDIQLSLRLGDGLRHAAGATTESGTAETGRRTVAALASGERTVTTFNLEGSALGEHLLLASVRDPLGWAAAGASNRVEIVAATSTSPSDAGTLRPGLAVALRLRAEAVERIEAGRSGLWRLALENVGDWPLEELKLVAEPGAGAVWVGPTGTLEAHVPRLEPGAVHPLEIVFQGEEAGLRVLRASVRDGKGWAAAGCAQMVGIDPAGTPAAGAPSR